MRNFSKYLLVKKYNLLLKKFFAQLTRKILEEKLLCFCTTKSTFEFLIVQIHRDKIYIFVYS